MAAAASAAPVRSISGNAVSMVTLTFTEDASDSVSADVDDALPEQPPASDSMSADVDDALREQPPVTTVATRGRGRKCCSARRCLQNVFVPLGLVSALIVFVLAAFYFFLHSVGGADLFRPPLGPTGLAPLLGISPGVKVAVGAVCVLLMLQSIRVVAILTCLSRKTKRDAVVARKRDTTSTTNIVLKLMSWYDAWFGPCGPWNHMRDLASEASEIFFQCLALHEYSQTGISASFLYLFSGVLLIVSMVNLLYLDSCHSSKHRKVLHAALDERSKLRAYKQGIIRIGVAVQVDIIGDLFFGIFPILAPLAVQQQVKTLFRITHPILFSHPLYPPLY